MRENFLEVLLRCLGSRVISSIELSSGLSGELSSLGEKLPDAPEGDNSDLYNFFFLFFFYLFLVPRFFLRCDRLGVAFAEAIVAWGDSAERSVHGWPLRRFILNRGTWLYTSGVLLHLVLIHVGDTPHDSLVPEWLRAHLREI